MNSINNFFDKVFITTIEAHTDRKASMDERIGNIDFEYFSEIDIPHSEYRHLAYVHDLPDEFFTDLNLDKKFASSWSKGQLGCFANNIKLYNYALSNNYSKVLILEDDVVFKKSAFANFERAIKELPLDWDILFFGYKHSNYQSRYIKLLKKLYYKITNRQYENLIPKRYSSHLDIPPKKFVGAFAYGLSKKGIQKILSYKDPIQEFGDVLFAEITHNSNFKVFCIYPHIAKEANFISSTQSNW